MSKTQREITGISAEAEKDSGSKIDVSVIDLLKEPFEPKYLTSSALGGPAFSTAHGCLFDVLLDRKPITSRNEAMWTLKSAKGGHAQRVFRDIQGALDGEAAEALKLGQTWDKGFLDLYKQFQQGDHAPQGKAVLGMQALSQAETAAFRASPSYRAAVSFDGFHHPGSEDPASRWVVEWIGKKLEPVTEAYADNIRNGFPHPGVSTLDRAEYLSKAIAKGGIEMDAALKGELSTAVTAFENATERIKQVALSHRDHLWSTGCDPAFNLPKQPVTRQITNHAKEGFIAMAADIGVGIAGSIAVNEMGMSDNQFLTSMFRSSKAGFAGSVAAYGGFILGSRSPMTRAACAIGGAFLGRGVAAAADKYLFDYVFSRYDHIYDHQH